MAGRRSALGTEAAARAAAAAPVVRPPPTPKEMWDIARGKEGTDRAIRAGEYDTSLVELLGMARCHGPPERVAAFEERLAALKEPIPEAAELRDARELTEGTKPFRHAPKG